MPIRSIDELKTVGNHEVYISFGVAMSSKDIYYNGNTFEVFSGIDGTMTEYNERDLLEQTNIGIALAQGALYRHN